MKKLVTAFGFAAALAAPALALQPQPQPQTPAATQPQTQRQTPPTTSRVAPTLPNVLIVFERTDYNGQSYQVRDIRRNPVVTPNGNWLIRSFSIHPGDRWEICGQSRFRDCVTLDRSVQDVTLIGLPAGRIGSTRQVTAPPAAR